MAVFHITGARLVVSERGETLSPKYAPDTMAPAVIASDIPIPLAIPIKATPTVAAARPTSRTPGAMTPIPHEPATELARTTTAAPPVVAAPVT